MNSQEPRLCTPDFYNSAAQLAVRAVKNSCANLARDAGGQVLAYTTRLVQQRAFGAFQPGE